MRTDNDQNKGSRLLPLSPCRRGERERGNPLSLLPQGRKGARRARSHTRGFTLVEVLAALAVIAIALTAVMSNFSQGIGTTIALRERTIALWIAQNRLATHHMNHTWPNADTTEGDAEMAGKQWRWRELVATTPDADIRRVEIEIRSAPDREALARLVGFLAKPGV